MRSFSRVLALSLLLLAPVISAPKEEWWSIKTKNFLLVGNAPNKEIRKMAVKLEQFRFIFAKLFPKNQFKSNIPLRVIVFKSRADYQPFMPVYQGKVSEVAGYFQPGEDIHHIALTAEPNAELPARTIFHEYTHAALSDNTRPLPVWLNEGLAEYYGGFELKDDKTIVLGQPHADHVARLRQGALMPLTQLFAVNSNSAEYNERDKKSMFYAEAWAFVHYLSLGNQGKRQPQLLNFVKLLMSGTPTDAAIQQAFQTDAATLEKELRDYIQRGSFAPQQYYARERVEFEDELAADKLSEAEWQYYLGNLAVHLGYVNGEPYLEKALALDGSLTAAHAALGLAKMRAGKPAEAKRHLQNALEMNAPSAFVPYYYALALFEEAAGGQKEVSDLSEMTAVAMRGQLKRAIALDANFTEAYRLLAFIYLVRNENLNEAVTLLTQAIKLNPGRAELGLLLGQIYHRLNRFAEAQQVLEPLAQNATDPVQREQAAKLLAAAKRVAEQNTRYATPTASTKESGTASGSTQVFTPRPSLRKRFDGEKAEGKLIKMSCEKGLTITVQGAQKTWEFHAANPDRVQFVTLAQNAEEPINCGTLSPAPRVIVTYRYNTDAQAGNDGELIAVEFVNR